MKNFSPIAKIITIVIAVAIILIGAVLLILYNTVSCNQYSSQIVIGKIYDGDGNQELPIELVRFLENFTREEICEDCCYYPKRYMKITKYFLDNNTNQLDSINQEVELYNKKLKETTKKYDLPEIEKSLKSIVLDDAFFKKGEVDSKTFKSEITGIVNLSPEIKILFYSTTYPDTNLVYELNNKVYKIYTDIEELLDEKYRYLSSGKTLEKKKILLIYNPIFEKKYIRIINSDSSQRILDGNVTREIQFRSNENTNDSISWQIEEVSNVKIEKNRGTDRLLPQRIHLIDTTKNGSIEINVKPYKGGYISSSFSYRIIVIPKPPPLPNIEDFTFNKETFTIKWKRVDGAGGYDLNIKTNGNFIYEKNIPDNQYTLSKDNIREIISSNGEFKVQLDARNSNSRSPRRDTTFYLDMNVFFQVPSIDKSRSSNTDTFKWRRYNPFEEYIVELSKSTECDDCVIINSQIIHNNEFMIEQGLLPSGLNKDNNRGTMYVYYFKIKSKLFDQTTEWSKPVMFQWVDGKILLCN